MSSETHPVSNDTQPAESTRKESILPAPVDTLTEAEIAERNKLVTRFKNLTRDTWFDRMEILAEIRDKRLYREKHATFEEFCQKELGVSRANVNRQCRTARIAKVVATIVAKPKKESHVRPLLLLEDEADQIEAYRNADKAATKKKPLNASMVTAAVKAILDAKGLPRPAPKPPTKRDIITDALAEATRELLVGLEPDQIEPFRAALGKFVAKWKKAQPTAGRKTAASEKGGAE